MNNKRNSIKVAFVGGGSQSWAPRIIRDIIFKQGMENVDVEFALLDNDLPRAEAIKRLYDVKLDEWSVDRVKLWPTDDKKAALENADFVLIAISTGRLETMRWDLEIPEKYGIYQTVGDTCGPGGWSRALRNIPVFDDYARLIRELCPNAYVLNYTNPMSHLTSVLAKRLGVRKVVGLCHGLFTNYEILGAIFGVDEKDMNIQFGGLNHFFWITDFSIGDKDGYEMLQEKLGNSKLYEIVSNAHADSMGWHSDIKVASELFDHYRLLPYLDDRHICEFFNCYMTNIALHERFSIVRTSIKDREELYAKAEKRINDWTNGHEAELPLDKETSRETAADIIKAITFNEPFMDIVNMINCGQISNLPFGAVVETMGCANAGGFSPNTLGELPESIATVCRPHAEVQMRTVNAGLNGDLNEALLALMVDPICAHLAPSDINKMGMELISANKEYLPQF